MNICMVLDNSFRPDTRVEKEARTLLRVGHRIFLLPKGEKRMPKIEDVDGIKVIRIIPPKAFIWRAMSSIWFSMTFDNPFLRRHNLRCLK